MNTWFPATPDSPRGGRPRGTIMSTGAKRGRKPRGGLSVPSFASSRPLSNDALPTTTTTTATTATTTAAAVTASVTVPTTVHWTPSQTTASLSAFLSNVSSSAASMTPAQLLASLSSARATASQTAPTLRPTGVDEDGDGDDELFPAMADDDYSAQLSWQSQSKDNVK
jgi:transcription initiation factor TFIID subunit 11